MGRRQQHILLQPNVVIGQQRSHLSGRISVGIDGFSLPTRDFRSFDIGGQVVKKKQLAPGRFDALPEGSINRGVRLGAAEQVGCTRMIRLRRRLKISQESCQ